MHVFSCMGLLVTFSLFCGVRQFLMCLFTAADAPYLVVGAPELNSAVQCYANLKKEPCKTDL
jgi:hypothetical protein